MADLEELEKKQRDLKPLIDKLAKEKDPAELQRLAAKLQERVKELEKSAMNLAAAAAPLGPRNDSGETRVTLTPDQRARIAEQTGVGMETLVMDRDAAAWARAMPTAEKRIIELQALKQASVSVMKREKQKAVDKLIKELKKIEDPTPEVQEIIAQLEKDPEGIGELAKEIAKRQEQPQE
jgi:hypothetical protein